MTVTVKKLALDLKPHDQITVDGRQVTVTAVTEVENLNLVSLTAVDTSDGERIHLTNNQDTSRGITTRTHTCPLCERWLSEKDRVTVTGTARAVRELLIEHISLMEHDLSEVAEHFVDVLMDEKERG